MPKTMVVLDPEYVPWDEKEDRARMRRVRKPLTPEQKKAALMVAGVLMVVVVGIVVVMAVRSAATPHAATPPTATPTASPTQLPPNPQDVLQTGMPGKLGLRRDQAVTFLNCQTFVIRNAGNILAAGDTASGPVIDVTGVTVEVECDGSKTQF